MSNERTPLAHVVGRIGQDPTSKETSKGDLISFSIAETVAYGDDAKPNWIDIAVWNEGLQAAVQAKNSGIQKGATVAIEGNLKENGQYNPSMSATRIGLVTWLARQQAPAETTDDDDSDF